jgi:NAD(P)-dependent dehydrogenase (short-subunit alcohol dehydrogenase family)
MMIVIYAMHDDHHEYRRTPEIGEAMSQHSGKTAIVTGASTGIGRASAEALARAGFTVFGTSRRAMNDGPSQVSMLTCDVTDDASVNSLVSTVLSRTGRIDVLVNNAGIGLLGGAEESSISQVQALFDVNLFGVMRLTNAVLPSMRQRSQGRIINISSVLGLIPAPYSAHYSATKHALEGYSESLDHETRAFNIRVSLIEPAYTRSVFEQSALEPDSPLKEYQQARADARALLRDAMTIADQPEVVAKAVLLAATAARPGRRYPTGKVARQVSVLRRFVPAEMFDKSLRKQMRLPV